MDGAGERTAGNIIKLWKTVGDIVSGFVGSFRTAWNKDGLGEGVIKSFTDRFNNLLELIRKVADTFKNVWNDGAGEAVWGNILNIVRNVNNIIGGFWGKLKKAWDENDNGITIWSGILGIVEKISGFFKTISGYTLDFIKDADFSPILGALGTLLKCFEDLVKIISDKFADVYKEILLPFGKWTLEKALPTIINLVAGALEILADVISLIPIDTIKTFTAVIGGLWIAFKGFKLVSNIAGWFSKLRDGIVGFAAFVLKNPIAGAVIGIAAAITALVVAVQAANRQKWERSDLKKATIGYLTT
jgi:hypothetical protein